MSRLFDTYRAVHEQGFVPIFVDDNYDSKTLVEACVEAGTKVIEYTLRRRDANKMIPWIRKNYPDLYLLVGSTLDNDAIVAHAKTRHPQLLTLSELDDMGVDGFVSMIGWSQESIKTYCANKVIMPSAGTVNEAFTQICAGAHFIKLIGPNLDLVKLCRAQPAFDYCPILMTGGMTLATIPGAIDAGVILAGSGFEVIMKDRPGITDRKEITEALKQHIKVAGEARAKRWPNLAKAAGGDRETWLTSLPHYHPF